MSSLSPTGTYEAPVGGHYLDTIKVDGLDLFFNTAAFGEAGIDAAKAKLEGQFSDWPGGGIVCSYRDTKLLNTTILSIDGLGGKTYRDIFNLLAEILPKAEGYVLQHTDMGIRDDACVINVGVPALAATQ